MPTEVKTKPSYTVLKCNSDEQTWERPECSTDGCRIALVSAGVARNQAGLRFKERVLGGGRELTRQGFSANPPVGCERLNEV
jgi:hypothetical protein